MNRATGIVYNKSVVINESPTLDVLIQVNVAAMTSLYGTPVH
jgi:hypothetical protein